MMGLFLPTSQRVYIKATPQKSSNPSSSGLDKLKKLALDLVPQFDTTRIIFDAVTNEEHFLENIVPENPLEDGSFVNDHIANLPKSLTLDAIISDTPIDQLDPTYGRIDSGKGRSNEVHDRLEKIYDAGDLVTVVTGMKVRQNMVIKSIRSVRNNSGYKIASRIELRQIQIASSSASAGASTFQTLPDEEIEHGISAGQVFGAVALVALASQ
jgi:hypothetical protein